MGSLEGFPIALPPEVDDVIKFGFSQNLLIAIDALKKIKVNNIRAVKKLDTFLAKLQPFIHDLSDETHKYVVLRATILAWLYFSRDQGAIPWNWIRTLNLSNYYYNLASKGNSINASQKSLVPNEEDEYVLRLRSWGYHNSNSDVEIALINALESGSINKTIFEAALGSLESGILEEENRGKLHAVWDIIGQSFDDNEIEFVEGIVKCFRDHSTAFTPRDLDISMHHLKALGRVDEAQRILDLYFDVAQGIAPNTLSYHSVDITQQEIKERLVRISQGSITQKSIMNILTDTIFHSMSNSDASFDLQNHTKENWYDFFKHCLRGNMRLGKYVYKAIEISKEVSDSKMTDDIVKALTEIAQESKINRYRLSELISKGIIKGSDT